MEKALAKLQSGLAAKQSKLGDEANAQLNELAKILDSGEISDAKRQQISKLMDAMKAAKLEQNTLEKKIQAAIERRRAAGKKGKDNGEDASDWAQELKKEDENAAKIKNELEKAERLKIRSLLDQEKAVHDRDHAVLADDRQLTKLLDELQQERKKIKSKELELSDLRREINDLRDEIEKMKKEGREKDK
jgi:hypothetical protein